MIELLIRVMYSGHLSAAMRLEAAKLLAGLLYGR